MMMIFKRAMAVYFAGVMLTLPAIGQENRPVMKAGEMPTYPAIARQARIEGTVVLKITTDGNAVEKVEVVSGHPMLVGNSVSAVKAWQFETHEPTTFTFKLTYDQLTEADEEVRRENPEGQPPFIGSAVSEQIMIETRDQGIICILQSVITQPSSPCTQDGKPVPCDLLLKSGVTPSSMRWTR